MHIFISTIVHRELDKRFKTCTEIIEEIDGTGMSLPALLETHKRIWEAGIRHPNFGPDRMGMFRTDDIAHMTLDNIVLGDVNGIWSNTASVFESMRDDEPDVYRAICKQYRNHLRSNLIAMRSKIYDNGFSRESITDSIVKAINLVLESAHLRGPVVQQCRIISSSIEDNKIINCELIVSNSKVSSSFLISNGEIYVPKNFIEGVSLTKKNMPGTLFFNVSDAIREGGDTFYNTVFVPGVIKEGKTNGNLSHSEAKRLFRSIKQIEAKQIKFGCSAE